MTARRDSGCRCRITAVVWIVAACLALDVLISEPIDGQDQTFDVTSVKPFKVGTGAPVRGFGCKDGRFYSLGGFPLIDSITFAYDIAGYQHSSLPTWADQNSYDIEAKASGPITAAQCRVMVQALLADRFKLAVHWEPKEMSVYEMVVAKGGPKLEKATESDQVILTINGTRVPSLGNDDSKVGWTMQELATFFTVAIYSPVLDRTKLEGVYRIHLAFSRSRPPGFPPGDDYTGPDAFEAAQKQLGLKLESRKDPIPFLVIDHIEKPNAN